MNEIINIKAFKAIEDVNTSIQFYNHQKEALSKYGLNNLTSLNKKWIYDENVYVIIAQLESNNTIIGGVRLHVKSMNEPLPIEEALHKTNYTLNRINNKNSTGELCALWRGEDNILEKDLSKILISSCLAHAYLLQLDTVFTFAGSHTVNLGINTGFELDAHNPGPFLYPTDNHITYILLANLKTILHREFKNNSLIRKLIQHPNHTEEYCTLDQTTTVNFDLESIKEALKQ